MRAIIRYIVSFVVLLAIFASCERRPLSELANYTNIKVEVDIEAVANVTCDIYNEKIPIPVIEPQAMHVLFYEPNSKYVAAETFITDIEYNSKGKRMLKGNISIMPGNYKMLIYDFGTEATIVDEYYRWDECKAYTNEISSSLKGAFKTRSDFYHNEVPLAFVCSSSLKPPVSQVTRNMKSNNNSAINEPSCHKSPVK